jgi:ribose 5-phosphate isomerase B
MQKINLTTPNIAIASDHAGYLYKKEIINFLKIHNILFQDYGANSEDSTNYANYGILAGEAILNNKNNFAIVICGTGLGIANSIAKVKSIQPALITNPTEIIHIKNNQNLNINTLAFGSRTTGINTILESLKLFFLNS